MRQLAPYCLTMVERAWIRSTGPLEGGGRAAAASVTHLGTDDRSTPRVRIVDAALGCIARHGIHRFTVDDLARQAGVSRATLYRAFPGGKESVLAAVVETERARLFADLAVVMGEAHDLEDVLVAGMSEAAAWFSSHEALAYVMTYEPEAVVTHLAFGEFDRMLEVATAFAAPFFERWLDPEQSARAAEWAARLLASYLTCPPPGIDLTRPADVRRLVGRFVVPGLQALRVADESDEEERSTPRISGLGRKQGR